jgi:hypothetical protein
MNLTMPAKHSRKTNLDCRGNEVLAGAALTLDDVINLFSLRQLRSRKTSWSVLVLRKTFQPGLIFASLVEAYLSGAPKRCSYLQNSFIVIGANID